MNGNKRKNTRVLRSGSYILVVTVVVIAIVIALNFIVAALPVKSTELDISKAQLYTIGEVTENLVKAISEDVNMFYIAEKDRENSAILKMLDSYDALSDRITVKTVDPAVNPNFAAGYTTESVSSGSVIVASEKRSTVVSAESLYKYNVDGYGELSTEEMYQLSYQMSSYGSSLPDYTAVFYGEKEFTSAVNYVTTDEIPSLYYTTGHGETELDTVYSGYVKTENYNYQSLTLLTDDIPEDAEALLINMPTYDLTAEETTKIENYVTGGGDLVFITDYTSYSPDSMPNLRNMMEKLGMKAANGVVFEGDTRNYYPNQPACWLLPLIGEDAEYSPVSKLPSSNINILFPFAHAIESSGAENTEFTQLLYTSESAFLKAKIDENTDPYSKQDGDTEGTFAVAAASRYTDGGRVVWYASSAIVDSSCDKVVSGGNSSMFIATLNMMAGKTESVSIIGKELSDSTLTVSEATVNMWRIVLCAVVPIAVIGSGLAVWVVRRRK